MAPCKLSACLLRTVYAVDDMPWWLSYVTGKFGPRYTLLSLDLVPCSLYGVLWVTLKLKSTCTLENTEIV